VDDFYTARARTSAGASLDGFLTAVHTIGCKVEKQVVEAIADAMIA
jgi:hypothetical protein